LKEVIIIGGGISGLTCGLHLAEFGYKVTILEKEAVIGGLARSFFIQGKWLPLTYHHVMLPDKTTQAYIKKFGLLNQLRWIESSQVFWYENKPYLLSQPQHIFSFDPLDFRSKLRLLYLGLYVWFKKDWDKLNTVDCKEWLNKVAGKKNTEMLFQNLMDIKFNMPLSSVSAAWLGKRMHQSIRNGDRYGYIDMGWQELFKRMAEEIIKRKGEIFTNFEVSKIINSNVEGQDPSGKLISLSADIIISTIPLPILNNILNLSDEVKSQLNKIKYMSVISFVCGSKDDISQYYWSVVLKPHLIFGGFFNHTVLSACSSINDKSVYYFFTYLESNNPLFDYEDDKIKDIYLKDIRSVFANFSLDWYKIFRLKFSQPIFVYNYKNLPIEFIDNIYLAGVYRQYPKPRTMDAAFYSGFETAQYIINKYGKS